jgi:uncharacterized protein
MSDSALVRGKKLPTADEVTAAGYKTMQRCQRVYILGAVNWLCA